MYGLIFEKDNDMNYAQLAAAAMVTSGLIAAALQAPFHPVSTIPVAHSPRAVQSPATASIACNAAVAGKFAGAHHSSAVALSGFQLVEASTGRTTVVTQMRNSSAISQFPLNRVFVECRLTYIATGKPAASITFKKVAVTSVGVTYGAAPNGTSGLNADVGLSFQSVSPSIGMYMGSLR
jgi:hypothetical protein